MLIGLIRPVEAHTVTLKGSATRTSAPRACTTPTKCTPAPRPDLFCPSCSPENHG
jgi:phosphoribosyl 1,2-cyclic phosphodiesterase